MVSASANWRCPACGFEIDAEDEPVECVICNRDGICWKCADDCEAIHEQEADEEDDDDGEEQGEEE